MVASGLVRIEVAFTPGETINAPVGVVVDVLRATTTITQALASGYQRVLCCEEVEEARALREALGEGVLGGERGTVPIPGFDLGNSPSEYVEPLAETVILTTTNGTRAIVSAAARCDLVLVASLLNLRAVVAAAAEREDDVAVICAGVRGAFTLDDAYVAGRIVALLEAERADSAEAAARLAGSFATAEAALSASKSGSNLRRTGLHADIAWCARESIVELVPHLTAMDGGVAEIAVIAYPRAR
jgi:2-phosphosulfolactate phosphatase